MAITDKHTIPFSPPFINESIINEVVDTLRSGWITTGPKVKALEHEIAKYTSAEQVACVNSATSGLFLALKWFGVTKGDEVIIPAYTYSATALVVLQTGATPVMVDVGEDFLLSPAGIRGNMTKRTKAIIPVDFGGMPCDYVGIMRVAEEMRSIFQAETSEQEQLGRALVVSDAAHSFGASIGSKKVGTHSDVTVFSFHAVKNLTSAEGGSICFNLPKPFANEEIFRRFKLLSLNGQTKDAFSKTQLGSWQYDIILQGYKMNMPDICAALALAQLRFYEKEILEPRQKLFDHYLLRLKESEAFVLPTRTSGAFNSSCHLFALRLVDADETKRNELINNMALCGISTNVHFVPLPLLTLFRNLGYSIEQFPNSLKLYQSEISLPLYPQLTMAEIDFICDSLML